jgi:hypothetical protein
MKSLYLEPTNRYLHPYRCLQQSAYEHEHFLPLIKFQHKYPKAYEIEILKWIVLRRTAPDKKQVVHAYHDASDLLEHQALMVYHTSLGFSHSGDRPTYGNNWSSDQLELYIS